MSRQLGQAGVVLDIIKFVINLIEEAFSGLDPAKMRKVTDILDDDNDLKLRAEMAFQDAKTRREFEGR
jgi:hypothetical protein